MLQSRGLSQIERQRTQDMHGNKLLQIVHARADHNQNYLTLALIKYSGQKSGNRPRGANRGRQLPFIATHCLLYVLANCLLYALARVSHSLPTVCTC